MATVVVGCKIPAGLVMEIVEPGKDDSGKIGVLPLPATKRVVLNGANSVQRRTGRKNALGEYPMLQTYPYGLTVVDEDFWKAWAARHKDFAFLKEGMIFMAPNQDKALAMAKERVGSVTTGLEPLMPATDGKSGDKRLSTEADPHLKKTMIENEQETPAAA